MSDVTALAKERLEIFNDIYRGNVPTRVPVATPLALEAMAQYSGASVAETFWDITNAEHVFDKVCQDFPGDFAPIGTRRWPSFYQLLGSKPFVMSSTGIMQHPEVAGMDVEDYDALISNPYDCIIEKILPRLYSELDTTPEKKALALAKAFRAWSDEGAAVGALNAKIRAKYGFATIAGGGTTAPFDFVADFFRGFNGIAKDIRRCPEKVKAACEALTPLLVKQGKLMGPPGIGMTFIALHMAPYLRTKDAELYYFPTLKDQVEQLTEMGANVQLFVEANYDRFLDYLQEMPDGTIMRFEEGDPKVVKEKLGKKFILTGFYPISLLMTGTKEQCVDKAKELLDILAPGGGYMFDFDKSALNLVGNFVENLRAVQEFVIANGVYSPEERSGNVEIKPRPNRSNEIVSGIEANINSKYYTTWPDYKAKHPELYQGIDDVIGTKIKRYEDAMFSFIINLCS